jgi:hypothetical protein
MQRNNEVAVFFIVDFLPRNESVAPRSLAHRASCIAIWAQGFDAANSIGQTVTAALKQDQEVVTVRRMIVMSV